jgi:hypothetical protein
MLRPDVVFAGVVKSAPAPSKWPVLAFENHDLLRAEMYSCSAAGARACVHWVSDFELTK